tara:strand:+ start:41 stop:526 length:486 start_codon:yes stop_codon:yes gene_type:complete
MSKLTKEDLTLWNLYKSKFKNINKKTELIEVKSNDSSKRKQMYLSDNKEFLVDERASKLLKKKKIEIDAHIDLHGLNQIEAKKKVKYFIKKSFFEKIRHIVIITGKGTDNKGVLKTATPNWLTEEDTAKFIIGFTTMPPSSGGEGAIYVKIRNITKYLNHN